MGILFLILIFLVNLIFGLGFKFYSRFFYFDTILHFWGGFFVAMVMNHYLKEFWGLNKSSSKKENRFLKKLFAKKSLIIISMTVFFGVIWEFFEYLITQIFGDYLLKNFNKICCIGNLDDTIEDLFIDLAGSIFYITMNIIKIKKD